MADPVEDYLRWHAPKTLAPDLKVVVQSFKVTEGDSRYSGFSAFKAWAETYMLASAPEEVKLEDRKWEGLVAWIRGRQFNGICLAAWSRK